MSNAGSGEELREVVARLQRELADLRGSRKRLASAAQADRRAIERAFHDGVQQHLVALAVDLQRLAGLVDGDPAAAKLLLDEMEVNMRVALDEAMELAQRVYPPLLGGRGLASALRAAAESAGVTVVVDVPARADYPPEITTAVYWSCVEALSSASRGSQATIRVLDADHTGLPYNSRSRGFAAGGADAHGGRPAGTERQRCPGFGPSLHADRALGGPRLDSTPPVRNIEATPLRRIGNDWS